MYSIVTFVAQHNPTEYTKATPGNPAVAIGYESVDEFDNYEACYVQLEAYRDNTAMGVKTWTAHKMYRDGKPPQLLHYIDNKHLKIALPSKA